MEDVNCVKKIDKKPVVLIIKIKSDAVPCLSDNLISNGFECVFFKSYCDAMRNISRINPDLVICEVSEISDFEEVNYNHLKKIMEMRKVPMIYVFLKTLGNRNSLFIKIGDHFVLDKKYYLLNAKIRSELNKANSYIYAHRNNPQYFEVV